jgi:uncharacterized RDD family membrane protein YckC
MSFPRLFYVIPAKAGIQVGPGAAQAHEEPTDSDSMRKGNTVFCPKCGAAIDDQAVNFCQHCGAGVSSAATPGAQQATASAPAVKYAGFWRRFAACIIDIAVLWVVAIVVAAIFHPWVGPWRDIDVLPAVLFWIVGPWLYWTLMESSPARATLGKMALGIIVTDIQGNRVSFGRASGRYWARIISSLLLCIGYFMAGFTLKKQALHDIIADCLVVVKKK